jgi:hypothetical protein
MHMTGSLAAASPATCPPPHRAAAILRCIASAPRLPSIGWAALLSRVFTAYAMAPPHAKDADGPRRGPLAASGGDARQQGALPRTDADGPHGWRVGVAGGVADRAGDLPEDGGPAGVRRACLEVAVRHGGTPAHGLSQLLEAQMEVACFGRLEEGLQVGRYKDGREYRAVMLVDQ